MLFRILKTYIYGVPATTVPFEYFPVPPRSCPTYAHNQGLTSELDQIFLLWQELGSTWDKQCVWLVK